MSFYVQLVTLMRQREGIEQACSRGIVIYAGTVMTSFYFASAPTRNNCFQTNQPEHEPNDRTGDTETSVCVNTDETDRAL